MPTSPLDFRRLKLLTAPAGLSVVVLPLGLLHLMLQYLACSWNDSANDTSVVPLAIVPLGVLNPLGSLGLANTPSFVVASCVTAFVRRTDVDGKLA